MATIGMSDLITPARVIPCLVARNKDALLRELVARLVDDGGVPSHIVTEAVVASAALAPFMPRGGVSLLHALIDELAAPIAVFARLKRPLDLNEPGGCATDIAVLLLSPAKAGEHLRALSCLARRLRRADVLAHLRATNCRDLMYVILTSDEWCEQERDRPSARAGGRTRI